MNTKAMLCLFCVMAGPALAQTFTYTSNADFDQGLLLNLNYGLPASDQLQVNDIPRPLPFVVAPNRGSGTVTRVNAITGDILGEYRAAPEGFATNSSRATVDLFGNVWVSNRSEAGLIDGSPHGSVVKVGLVTGGSRVNADGSPNPQGGYLAGPFGYNTCVDRDGDGLLRTSTGRGDVLDWVNVTDGEGGTDGTGHGLVEDATDECVLAYQRTPDALEIRHVSIDRNNDVWVGGYPSGPINRVPGQFNKLDGDDARVIDSFDARPFNAGGFNGLIDGNGILWSSGLFQGTVLRYDLATRTGTVINNPSSYAFGIDFNGFIWNSKFGDNSVSKISPEGVIQSTHPTGGSSGDRGVAVTPIDNHVWVANAGPVSGTNVSRLDNDGNLLKVITVGTAPSGVSVDSAGKIWVINTLSDNLMRIDPEGGSDGLGAVDLTVDVGAGRIPYSSSDFTGMVAIGNTSPQGNFTVVQDSAQAGLEWEQVLWNTEPEGSVPAGTSITVEVRASDNLAALPAEEFFEVENGISLSGQAVGRYLEVRTILRPDGDVSPVLSDLTLVALASGLLGDYDDSGLVGSGDLSLVLNNWGQTAPPVPDGWINQQPMGLIGAEQLGEVLSNWGASLSSVPEPSPVALTLLGFAAFVRRRR